MAAPSEASAAARTLLVPIDFSTGSREALLVAAVMASCPAHKLLILHVVHESARQPGVYRRPTPQDRILPIGNVAARMTRRFVDDVRAEYPELGALGTAEIVTVNGLPETRIPEVAAATDVDLIVMGRHDRGMLTRWLKGSVSEKVVQRSRIPVTIVGIPADASGTNQATGYLQRRMGATQAVNRA